MRVWLNKDSGELALATEWWEPIRITVDGSLYLDMLPKDILDFTKNKKIVTGTLLQVGWLIQNKHDFWFGVNTEAKKAFEDLGEA